MITVENIRTEHRDRSIFVAADVNSEQGSKVLWYEIPQQYEAYVAADRGDAFAVAFVVEAMFRRVPLHIAAPLSATLVLGLRYYQSVMATLYTELEAVEVTCDEVRYCPETSDGRVLCLGFSGGVDAFSTVFDHFFDAKPEEKAHCLFFGNAAIGSGPKNEQVFQVFQRRLHPVAAEIGLPLVFMNSNLDQHTSAPRGSLASRHLSYVLNLQGYIHTYLNQGATPYSCIIGDTDGAGPLSDHLLSTDATRIFSDGAQYTRIEKIDRISRWPIAQKYLHPCNFPTADMKNCSRCTKCVATMLAIDMLGKRADFSSAFDFIRFEEAKQEYVSRNRGKENDKSNFLWREIVEHARETNYAL